MKRSIAAFVGLLLSSQVGRAQVVAPKEQLTAPETVTNLAETRDDLFALATARSTPFVRTMADFDKYVASDKFKDGPLGKLDAASLKAFRDGLVFLEVTRNGAVYQQKTATVDTGSFTKDEIPNVMALFGIGKNRALGCWGYMYAAGECIQNSHSVCAYCSVEAAKKHPHADILPCEP